MLNFAEARARLLAAARPIERIETLPLVAALGRTLATPLISSIALPPTDVSAMDGCAVRAAECAEAPVCLPISQRIPAGATARPLRPGTAARIFTGAPIPPGADAVVAQEQCALTATHATVNIAVEAGRSIRRAGEEIAVGDAALTAGCRIRPQELGLAASIGAAALTLRARPRVAALTTGDELVEPGQPLAPGQIYDANRALLTGLLRQAACEPLAPARIPDDPQATRTALARAAAQADLVIAVGGVSVGEEDHVKGAVEALGRLDLWRIAVKPGKPLAFGRIGATPFIGLPGNPVSAFVAFLLFALPFIRRLHGEALSALALRPRSVRAGFAHLQPGDRLQLLRARCGRDASGREEATLHARQGAHMLTGAAWAEGLAMIPPGRAVAPGDAVDYLSFAELWA